MTSEEVEKDYVSKLGKDLGGMFYRLEAEFLWLHKKWNEYKLLFTQTEHIDVLNAVCGQFWEDMRKIMHNDILLHLCRLTDQPGSKLTIKGLSDHCHDRALRCEVRRLVNRANRKTRFARDWRNRYIAHTDLELAMNRRTAKPLRPSTRAKIEAAIQSIHVLLNAIREQGLKHATSEQRMLVYPPTALAFIAHLRQVIEVAVCFAKLAGIKESSEQNIDRAYDFLAKSGHSGAQGYDTAHELQEVMQQFKQLVKQVGARESSGC